MLSWNALDNSMSTPFIWRAMHSSPERVSPLYQLDHQSDEVRRYLSEFDQWGRGQRAGRERVVSHLEALDTHQRDFEALERAAKRAGHGVGGSPGLQDWINRRKDLAKTGEQLLAEPRYAPHLDNLAGARQRIEKVVALVRERAESLSNEPRALPGHQPGVTDARCHEPGVGLMIGPQLLRRARCPFAAPALRLRDRPASPRQRSATRPLQVGCSHFASVVSRPGLVRTSAAS